MAIVAIAGLPGSGKTYFAVRAMRRLRKEKPGRAIVSNFPIYLDGAPVPVVDTIDECLGLRECDIVLDEMHLWMSSRNWKQHGDELGEWLSQLRKVDVNLWYTAQDLSSVDKWVRDRTFLSYHVESFKRLGFFWFRAFFGVKDDRKKRLYSGWYFFNEHIARCYDTEYVVRV